MPDEPTIKLDTEFSFSTTVEFEDPDAYNAILALPLPRGEIVGGPLDGLPFEIDTRRPT